jgi:hypothetical protein
MVYDWFSRGGIVSSLEAMSGPDFDPAQEAVIVDLGRKVGGAEGKGQATIVGYEPERVLVVVEGDTEGLLILTDANYPGWQATIDSQVAPIVQTDVLFRGVIVPPGKHEVEFVFQPVTFQVGLIITIAGLFILIMLIGLFFVREYVSDHS